ncbi:MAG: transcriptional regulator FtsR [Actinomycetota bacterium]
MPLSRSRDYLSIGEVLDGLKGDFPDVSISKIRFLESEGLIRPERTPSGYRKFYDGDVEQLRHVLSLQKDHFMPLKVIKERLKDPTGLRAKRPAPGRGAARTAPAGVTDVQLDRAGLLKASGLTDDQLRDLEEFGIIPSDKDSYDGNALMVAKAAAGFLSHGVEARHLRMYRQAVEREMSFFEQIVTPVRRRKDPEGEKVATETIRQLEDLSRSMRDALLRSSVTDLL